MFRIPVSGNLPVAIVLSLFPTILFVLFDELFVVWFILFPVELFPITLFPIVLFPTALFPVALLTALFPPVTSFSFPPGFVGVSPLTLKLTVWSL